jgi:hypothetical protein
MPVPTYPSDEPRDDQREHRDPREIIKDIINGIQTETLNSHSAV